MVFASQNTVVTRLLGYDRERPMSANIMEGVDIILSISGNDKLESSYIVA
jgi:hypothetical protein